MGTVRNRTAAATYRCAGHAGQPRRWGCHAAPRTLVARWPVTSLSPLLLVSPLGYDEASYASRIRAEPPQEHRDPLLLARGLDRKSQLSHRTLPYKPSDKENLGGVVSRCDDTPKLTECPCCEGEHALGEVGLNKSRFVFESVLISVTISVNQR